jgi:hypothetical protein
LRHSPQSHKPDFILHLKFSKLVNSKVAHVYVLVGTVQKIYENSARL